MNRSLGKIRVLIADDHITVLEGLGAIIGRQSDMSVVAEASNGLEAVDLWKTHLPDVALMDLRMPHLGGVDAIRQIRSSHGGARILVLTTYDTDHEIHQAIQAGAKGYLLKDARREDLLDNIRRIHHGETCIAPGLVEKLTSSLSSTSLTSRELEVLTFLARGLSNKEIGSRLFVSETTIKSHLRSVFGKLNVLSRTEAIATASQRGLIRL